jgi:hypothetical protein
MDLLARWLPVIDGRAAPLERVARSGRVDRGRGELIDERNHELRRALTVHGRLGRVRALPGGARHLVVLRYVFLESGAEWRSRVDPRLDGGGVAEAVGRRFADPAVAARWATHPQRSLRKALPRKYGESLLDEAIEAYAVCVAENHQGMVRVVPDTEDAE